MCEKSFWEKYGTLDERHNPDLVAKMHSLGFEEIQTNQFRLADGNSDMNLAARILDEQEELEFLSKR